MVWIYENEDNFCMVLTQNENARPRTKNGDLRHDGLDMYEHLKISESNLTNEKGCHLNVFEKCKEILKLAYSISQTVHLPKGVT